MKINVFVIFSSFMFLAFGYIGWTLAINPMFYTTEQVVTFRFCDMKGHETVPLYRGIYQEYENKNYGRVICGDCYVEGCKYKTYNVTMSGPGGYLSKLSDVNVGVGEQ